jgi:hypothetical protein
MQQVSPKASNTANIHVVQRPRGRISINIEALWKPKICDNFFKPWLLTL